MKHCLKWRSDIRVGRKEQGKPTRSLVFISLQLAGNIEWVGHVICLIHACSKHRYSGWGCWKGVFFLFGWDRITFFNKSWCIDTDGKLLLIKFTLDLNERERDRESLVKRLFFSGEKGNNTITDEEIMWFKSKLLGRNWERIVCVMTQVVSAANLWCRLFRGVHSAASIFSIKKKEFNIFNRVQCGGVLVIHPGWVDGKIWLLTVECARSI